MSRNVDQEQSEDFALPDRLSRACEQAHHALAMFEEQARCCGGGDLVVKSHSELSEVSNRMNRRPQAERDAAARIIEKRTNALIEAAAEVFIRYQDPWR